MYSFLLFFNISGGEILVIIIVIYLVFGPKKIPEFARMLGKGINEMRRATNDIKNEITREANKIKKDIDIDIDDPFKNDEKTDSSAEPYKPPNMRKEEDDLKTTGKPPENKTKKPDRK